MLKKLADHNLAYLHLVEGGMGDSSEPTVDYRAIRDRFGGNYMANLGYDKARANQALAAGECDVVSFGVPFLANPDLVYRFEHELPLNEPNVETFYGGDETGYTDYPFADELKEQSAG